MSARLGDLLDRYSLESPSLPPDASTPWYLIGLASVGSIVAGGVLMVALTLLLAGVDLSPEIMAILGGLIALGGGLFIGRMSKGLFLNQFATTGTVAGQILVAGGTFGLTESMAAGVVMTWAIGGVTIALLRDPFQQVLLTAVATAATCVWVVAEGADVGLPLLTLCTVPLGLAALFTPPRRLDVRPAAFALLVVPLGLFEPLVTTYPLHVMAALPYVAGALWVLWPALTTPVRTVAAVAGGLALAGLAPGVTGALMLLAVAWRLGNRAVAGLGVIALLLFVVRYYYAVDVTLLVKSGLLMAGGILTLGLWMGWRRMAP